MALRRANAQQWRCPAVAALSPPGGSWALVVAKERQPLGSAIAAHLLGAGPSRADRNRARDDVRR